MKADHSILSLCENLDVSSSGYYGWQERRRVPGQRAGEDESLTKDIQAIHQRSRQTYGSPRIAMELRKEGKLHGRSRIARLMRAQGLCGRQKRRYRAPTTDSNHAEPIAPNHLAKAPAPTGPDQIWVKDITYIQTGESWLYLAAILDLYSRKIVGWAMSDRIDTALVLSALSMALAQRGAPLHVLCHSDQGVQYASADYRAALSQAGLVASMSRRGNCYDNAFIESFWSTLKLELIYRGQFASRQQARSAIFDYIEIFYNRQRAHSSLGCLSPVDFELLNN
jgi:putative transposase